MSSEEARNPEIFFLPFISISHMIPMVDTARLFAARGVQSTIITTPYNALLFQKAIDHDIEAGRPIAFHLIKFPREEVGLPEGIENINGSVSIVERGKLFKAIFLLQQPMEQLIRQCLPNCIISDMFYPWTAGLASQLGIPRIVYYVSSFFSLSAEYSIDCYTPHRDVGSDTEPFKLQGFPDEIKMTRFQLAPHLRTPDPFGELMKHVNESISKSYGVLAHSFYELEANYVQYYKKNIKDKVWHIGPVGLFNKDDTEIKGERGSNKTSHNNCLGWLDSKKPNSVLYICFGSMTRFTNTQLFEIASGLEASDRDFIWVVRKEEKARPWPEDTRDDEWLPEGFEKRMMDGSKGMIIRGWAPQILILEHEAIGGFMTQGGWCSVLESVTSGVPMIVWPQISEQFFHEKLVAQVLNIGVAVGVEGPNTINEEEKILVDRGRIQKAVTKLMDGGGGDEVESVRKKVRELSVAAKRAMDEGGSSYNSLTSLIQEINNSIRNPHN